MGRQVVLRDLNIKGNSDTAYKASNGKYYSSQEAYEKIVAEQEYRSDCIKLMYNLLDYDSFMKLPTIFYKKLKEWEPFTYRVVLKCINNKASSVDWALNNKSFNSEVAKMMYICAILDNGMVDALKEVRKEDRKKAREVAENKSEQVNNVAIANPIQQTKNISRWLEDD